MGNHLCNDDTFAHLIYRSWQEYWVYVSDVLESIEIKLKGCVFKFNVLKYFLYMDLHKEEYIMAFEIKDACISCGACAGNCPVGAISEGDGKFEINPDTCVSCGACAGGCPVGAIEEA